MGTRSLTHFIDQDGSTAVTVYRHWDGYPEVAGADLLRFLDLQASAPGTGSRVGDPGYLAARYVAFLADHFRHTDYMTGERSDNVCDFLSVGICPPGVKDWGPEEYVYRVNYDGTAHYLEVGWDREARAPKYGRWRRLTLKACTAKQ